MTSEDRPTLTGEENGTEVTVDVDVPREVYEREVAEKKRINSLPDDDWPYGPAAIVDGLMDMIDLEITFYVDGEEAFVGIPGQEEDHGDG